MLTSAMLQPSGRTTEVGIAIGADGVLALSNGSLAALPVRLMRRKFDRHANHAAFRQRFVSDLAAVAEWVTTTDVVFRCRDPDDDSSSRRQSTARPAIL
ncbi:MAG TPA: hypothetical protein VE592_03035 [Geminicoccaceae bacterium]|nr:hypothetical protein [Geminicoccaceae bacterium]